MSKVDNFNHLKKCYSTINKSKSKNDKTILNIEEIIYNNFIEIPVNNFDSYKERLEFYEHEKEFEKTLSESQKEAYCKVTDMEVNYLTKRQRELINYVFNFMRAFFK